MTSKYNSSWEENLMWLRPVKRDMKSAFCSSCNCSFGISGGVGQMKHEGTVKHVRNNKTVENCRTINTSSKNLSLSNTFQSFSPAENITRAEILQVWYIVQCNFSFASADNDNIRFKLMFPDSKIVQGYSQGHTKANYMSQYGIVPYIKEELLKGIKDVPYCFKFETTNSQIKKQYVGYITFYSQSENVL